MLRCNLVLRLNHRLPWQKEFHMIKYQLVIYSMVKITIRKLYPVLEGIRFWKKSTTPHIFYIVSLGPSEYPLHREKKDQERCNESRRGGCRVPLKSPFKTKAKMCDIILYIPLYCTYPAAPQFCIPLLVWLRTKNGAPALRAGVKQRLASRARICKPFREPRYRS
jgi:hypothetical protein